MPMEVTIANPNVLNLLQNDVQELARDLAGYSRLRKTWERVRDEVTIPSIDQNFELGGRPQRWEPIQMRSFVQRKSVGGGVSRDEFIEMSGTAAAKPLDDTGQLRRSATAKTRFHIKENEMTYGNWPPSRWFGPVHNFGARGSNFEIPARPFTLIHQEDTVQIAEILMEWVEDRVNDNIKLHYV